MGRACLPRQRVTGLGKGKEGKIDSWRSGDEWDRWGKGKKGKEQSSHDDEEERGGKGKKGKGFWMYDEKWGWCYIERHL